MTEIKIPIPTQPDNFWTLRHLNEVDSTNRVAADLARKGFPEGQVILADHQSAGRGRLDREWIDTPGSSVLVSVLLRPKFSPQFFFLITFALSLATSQVLRRKFSIPCKLKWPNDVMVSDSKIAGILAEASFDGSENAWVIIGMGLNCLQSEEVLASIGRSATSIFAETRVTLDLGGRISLAQEIVEQFMVLYLSLSDPVERKALGRLYRDSCETIGSLVKVEMVEETLIGVATDISVEGNLLVETDDSTRVVPAGDVVHLRKTT
ncbi:MAG: biotin--[acetyl-CoA-carboxylase] ligase [Actinomycetota bacterium]|nr:biotin--[acetyl-CoA-carboxylase] ligase [Actinomycetota bacterium]